MNKGVLYWVSAAMLLSMPLFAASFNGAVLYVDNNAAFQNADGSRERPFSALRQAVDFIDRRGVTETPVQIELLSNLVCLKPLVIQHPIVIYGREYRTIRFGKNGGFIVEGVFFRIQNCRILRIERVGEPRDVPVIYASNAEVDIQESQIIGKEAYSLIRLYHTNFVCVDSVLHFEAAYTVHLLTMLNSTANIERSTLFAHANVVYGLSLTNSAAHIKDSTITVSAQGRATAIRAVYTGIILQATKVLCKTDNPFTRRFRAAVLDAYSDMMVNEGTSFTGFYHDTVMQFSNTREMF